MKNAVAVTKAEAENIELITKDGIDTLLVKYATGFDLLKIENGVVTLQKSLSGITKVENMEFYMSYQDATYFYGCQADTNNPDFLGNRCFEYPLSLFPADSVFNFYKTRVFFYSAASNQLGYTLTSKQHILTLPQTNLVFQADTYWNFSTYVIFFNPDLLVYEMYSFTTKFYRQRFQTHASSTALLMPWHKDKAALKVSEYGGTVFSHDALLLQKVSNKQEGCDTEVYTYSSSEQLVSVETSFAMVGMSTIPTVTTEYSVTSFSEPAFAQLDFFSIQYYPGLDCYANTEFEDVTSQDLFAYLDKGTFTLVFPEVYVCSEPFTYQVDNFELKDDLDNDVLLPPLSSDSSGINYDADHALAALQQTLLHATIYDSTTNAPDVIDITFSFVLHVEDGNTAPFVDTNDCLDETVEQGQNTACLFFIDDANS